MHYLLLTALLILAGCMQTVKEANADRPDWLESESAQFPNSRFITANGSADDAERAKDRALANLSKVFELRIRESSTTVSDVVSQKRDGAESVSSSQRLTQNINVQTNKIIEGARIAQQWFDKAELTHHALAVLDRRQAGNNIRAEIERVDKETEYELARPAQNKLQQVALLNKAVALQMERSVLQKTLKIIDLSGRGEAARWNMAELREKLDNSLIDLKMAAAVNKDDIGDLDNLTAGAMGKAGFPPDNSNYEYVLATTFVAQPVFENQGWFWLRGILSLQLSDTRGRVLGNRTWPIKVSSVQQALLIPRARAAVEKTLSENLRDTILGFASTQ